MTDAADDFPVLRGIFLFRESRSRNRFSLHTKSLLGRRIVRGKQAFCSTFSASTYVGCAMLRALFFSAWTLDSLLRCWLLTSREAEMPGQSAAPW
jgi:hypothetical protein